MPAPCTTKHSVGNGVQTMYTMAQRPGGATATEAAQALGVPVGDVNTRMNWMWRTGRLTKKAVDEGRTKRRFFADPNQTLQQVEAQLMKAYRQKMAVNGAKGKGVPKNYSNPRTPKLHDVRDKPHGLRARTGAAPLMLPGSSDRGSAEQAAGAKRKRVETIVCAAPTHDGRYQIDPGSRIEGGFAAMGVGRYLDGTRA